MRILVTGGAGFLGSHLCDRLVEDGYEVLCVDNYFSGRKSNIQHLAGNINFDFHTNLDERVLELHSEVSKRSALFPYF